MHPAAKLLQVGGEQPQLLQVAFPQGPRLGQQFPGFFKSLEQRRLLERKFDLLRVEDLKRHHLVLLVAQVAKAFLDAVHVVEEIAQQDDQAAVVQFLGQLIEDAPRVGLLQSRGDRKLMGDDLPLPGRIARLDVVLELIVEDRQPRRVLLLDDQV